MDRFERTEWLLGKDITNLFGDKHIAIFGLGGVGGYVCECLARMGFVNFTVVDFDTVSESNINRQIIATTNTIGKLKTQAIYDRIKNINPNAVVNMINDKIGKDNIDELDFAEYDYIIDAVDTVTTKILLIEKAKQFNKHIISCMGTGNKIDPTKLQITDISLTKECPLAKVMRHELKKRNITNVTVVWSTELARTPLVKQVSGGNKQTPASCVFVPATAGILIAYEVCRQIGEDSGR